MKISWGMKNLFNKFKNENDVSQIYDKKKSSYMEKLPLI